MAKVSVSQFIKPCRCRTIGECNHNISVEGDAIEKLVSEFSKELKAKLLRKWRRDGYTGWDDDSLIEFLFSELHRHAYKYDWLDVAAFAVFLWNLEATKEVIENIGANR